MDSGTWITSVISFHHSVWAKASKTSMCLPSSMCLPFIHYYCLHLHMLACVELHGHTFRPTVWLWKPFQRCCVNVSRRWDTKASLIDVFAAFLVLSYSKLLFVSAILFIGTDRDIQFWWWACVICSKGGCDCEIFKQGTSSICYRFMFYHKFYVSPSTSADFLPLQSI